MKKGIGIILALMVMFSSGVLLGRGIIKKNGSYKESTEQTSNIEATELTYAENEEETEEPTEDNIDEIKISLAGDVLLDGHIRNYIHKDGYDYPWHYVKKYFQNDDITIVNLETSITRGGDKWADKQFNFRSDPQNVDAMKRNGIDVVSLANNHSLDYGYKGLKDTLKYLKEGDINSVGAGVDRQEAMKSVIIQIGNTKVGILGFSRVVPDVGWWATNNRAGLVGAYDGQLKNALKTIEELKKEVDIVVVSVHWGKELQEKPREQEITAAKKMIDSGADIIAGHHPHILQGIDIYNGRPIFYSLGNFVFGTKSELTANTMIAQLIYKDKILENIQIIPLNIVKNRPEGVDEQQSREKLNYLRELSKDFDTVIDKDGNIMIEVYE